MCVFSFKLRNKPAVQHCLFPVVRMRQLADPLKQWSYFPVDIVQNIHNSISSGNKAALCFVLVLYSYTDWVFLLPCPIADTHKKKKINKIKTFCRITKNISTTKYSIFMLVLMRWKNNATVEAFCVKIGYKRC